MKKVKILLILTIYIYDILEILYKYQRKFKFCIPFTCFVPIYLLSSHFIYFIIVNTTLLLLVNIYSYKIIWHDWQLDNFTTDQMMLKLATIRLQQFFFINPAHLAFYFLWLSFVFFFMNARYKAYLHTGVV